MTAADLKSRTVRDLASMARKKNVPGWHTMRKEELVKALLRHTKTHSENRAGGNRRIHDVHASKKAAATHQKIVKRLEEIQDKLAEAKDLAFRSVTEESGGVTKDRLVVMVRDPYWLHAYWDLSRKSVERVKAVLGPYWHGARPVLRVYEVVRDDAVADARHHLRDIRIHGGVKNWYLDVQNPPKTYQLDIGYLVPGGRFYCLARSNVVTTPPEAAADNFDKNWTDVAKNYDRIFALSGGYSEQEAKGELKEVFEERLQRPIGDQMLTLFGLGHPEKEPDFEFEVDTELIIHGVTQPDALVTLRGEPVKIRSDGTFAVRFHLPDRRHVLPMTASSRDGAKQRTVVLAIDRNLKVMEAVHRDPAEG